MNEIQGIKQIVKDVNTRGDLTAQIHLDIRTGEIWTDYCAGTNPQWMEYPEDVIHIATYDPYDDDVSDDEIDFQIDYSVRFYGTKKPKQLRRIEGNIL